MAKAKDGKDGKTNVIVRMPEEWIKELKKIANPDRTMQDVIREFIRQGLDRRKG